MVSSLSNPGFPPVHAHPTHLPAMDARLFAAIDSFEASMCVVLRDAICEAMDSALTAIHKAMNLVLAEIRSDLTQLRHNSTLGVKGDSDPASMCSKEAESIEVGHQKPHNDFVDNPRPFYSAIALIFIDVASTGKSVVKPHSNNFVASIVLLPESKTMISAPQLLHKHSFSDATKIGPEVVLNLSIISATPEAKFSSLLTDNYGAYPKDKFGWVNWYLVGKFVKKNLYALHLFDDMSKRHNRENM